jgi:hypothetical protein
MNMKRHMLICFFISMLVDRGKEWDSSKMEVLMKPAKLYKKKAPKQGREKETRGKDQSLGKQTSRKRRATRRKGNH